MGRNGKPFYDAEVNALGVLPKHLYMLFPSNWPIPICDAQNVGKGVKVFSPPIYVIAGVYALAKEQYESVDKANAVKWAVLRMEAFKAGWFDNQKFTMRKSAPKDALKIFERDSAEIMKFASEAWKACGFIPFLFEFCFRTYGTAYTGSSASEYVARAEKLARSSQLDGIINYLPNEVGL